jgi:hypothetical protein
MEPMTTTIGLPIRSTIRTGSMIASPNTWSVPAVTITVMTENARKLTDRPRKLPIFIAASLLPKRAKSPKFNKRALK